MTKRAFASIGAYALIFAAGIVLAVWSYAPALDAPFVFDDHYNITQNPAVRMTEITLRGLFRAAFESPLTRRPLANATFALNYSVHQYRPAGYRLVNFCFHLGSGLLIFLITRFTLRRTLADTPAVEAAGYTAAAAAVIWTIHPLHIQTVTYIVQRMNGMAAFFFLLSLFCYLRARISESPVVRGLFWSGCLLSGIFSAGFKEIAVALPFMIVVYEWIIFQGGRRNVRLFAGAGAAAAIIAAGLFLYLGESPISAIRDTYTRRDFTLETRLLTQPRVVVYYLAQLFYPYPSMLNLDHDFSISRSLFSPPATFFSLVFLIAALVFAVWRRRHTPFLSLGILWFLGTLVVESSVIGLEIIYEHRTYLPSTLLVPAVLHAFFKLFRSTIVKVVFLVAICGIPAFYTHTRNETWRIPVRLFQDVVAKSPEKYRPRVALGTVLMRGGDMEAAIPHFKAAIELNPKAAEAHNNLGYIKIVQGRYREAVSALQRAVAILPHSFGAHNMLGYAWERLGNRRRALQHYRTAARIAPRYAKVYLNIGRLLASMGHAGEAIPALRRAVRLDPRSAHGHFHLGRALVRVERVDEAVPCFETALRLQPGFPAARRYLRRFGKPSIQNDSP